MRLRDLYQTYHQQVQFLVIYIQEAHQMDGWRFEDNLVSWLLRRNRSKAAMDIYAINRAYDALPTRLYLVGLDGRVVSASDPGSWNFKPGQLEKAIQQTLQIHSATHLSS